MPADGGDREAGGAPRPRRGEGPLLHLHWLPSASRGERRKVEGSLMEVGEWAIM